MDIVCVNETKFVANSQILQKSELSDHKRYVISLTRNQQQWQD